jgi:hypothetical protein
LKMIFSVRTKIELTNKRTTIELTNKQTTRT